MALPLIFCCEHTLYAVATHVAEVSREARLSGRGPDIRYFFMLAGYANAAERKLDHISA